MGERTEDDGAHQMTLTELKELRDRVRGLTGPDREALMTVMIRTHEGIVCRWCRKRRANMSVEHAAEVLVPAGSDNIFVCDECEDRLWAGFKKAWDSY